MKEFLKSLKYVIIFQIISWGIFILVDESPFIIKSSADLKVKSCDIEAWSPRQQKYFEVGSCSTLGDAQARRLGIRAKGENGNYYLHTLNNTVLANTRALIALIENNYNEDGTVNIPEVLRPYMGGKDKIEIK